jgi:hypothetical protein
MKRLVSTAILLIPAATSAYGQAAAPAQRGVAAPAQRGVAAPAQRGVAATAQRGVAAFPPCPADVPCFQARDGRTIMVLPAIEPASGFTTEGITTFITVFHSAAARGVENATIRSFNATRACPDGKDCLKEVLPGDTELAPAGPNGQASARATLFDRLGGAAKITAIVDDFVQRARDDREIDLVDEGTPREWHWTPENVEALKADLTG